MILYIPEGHSCAYSVDSEGAMYYTPLQEGGTLYLDETDVIDYDNLYEGCYEPELQEIQNQLIAMNKSAGVYYRN